ncbi:hypothetical protein TWF481_011762 [Arthrobotrys musiformis]|uniref:Uncharacterized protein n=1 Tax=Arthrobotrys musiformis TaxID=47236 RepID=A0AAV9VV31_9PEZI
MAAAASLRNEYRLGDVETSELPLLDVETAEGEAQDAYMSTRPGYDCPLTTTSHGYTCRLAATSLALKECVRSYNRDMDTPNRIRPGALQEPAPDDID